MTLDSRASLGSPCGRWHGLSGDTWRRRGIATRNNGRQQSKRRYEVAGQLGSPSFPGFFKNSSSRGAAQLCVIIWGIYFPPRKSKLTIFLCPACLFLGPKSSAKVQSNKTILFIGKVIKITEQALCPTWLTFFYHQELIPGVQPIKPRLKNVLVFHHHLSQRVGGSELCSVAEMSPQGIFLHPYVQDVFRGLYSLPWIWIRPPQGL